MGQATERPTVPPPSPPHWGSTAPTVERRRGSHPTGKADPCGSLDVARFSQKSSSHI